MSAKTVTFLVKSVRTNKLAINGNTTVDKLKRALETGGYDVEDAKIRIIRNGHSFIGHLRNALLHDNDIVVFNTNDVQMRVSQDIKQRATVSNGCSPECCSDRAEEMKRNILAALKDFESAIINA